MATKRTHERPTRRLQLEALPGPKHKRHNPTPQEARDHMIEVWRSSGPKAIQAEFEAGLDGCETAHDVANLGNALLRKQETK